MTSPIPAHDSFRPAGGWYLSPTSAHHITRHPDLFGVMESPRARPGRSTLKAGLPWAYDNDAFNDAFDFSAWSRGLIHRRPYRHTCLFVAAPDVLADCTATLQLFDTYEPLLHRHGWPIALVTQDGLTPDLVPWHRIDALFIGGSDHHKLGPEAGTLIASAPDHVWIHVARVNSYQRTLRFWRADSWDGTCLTHEPAYRSHLLARAVRHVRARKHQQLTLPGALP